MSRERSGSDFSFAWYLYMEGIVAGDSKIFLLGFKGWRCLGHASHRLALESQFLRRHDMSAANEIKKWKDIPNMGDIANDPVDWIVEGFLASGCVTLLAGSPGSYKSTLALSLSHSIVRGENFLGRAVKRRAVLYLDLENPQAVIFDRLRRFGMQKIGSELKYWGGWAADAPPQIGDPRLLKFAKRRKLVIVVDSFLKFHNADENSSTEMSRVMHSLRRLAWAGAAVLVLHHQGKSGSGYRGSSEIRAGVDVEYTIRLQGHDGVVHMSCTKNRIRKPFSFSFVPDLRTGEMKQVDSPNVKRQSRLVAKLLEVIRDNPGITQNQIAKLVGRRNRLPQILKAHRGELWQIGEELNRSSVHFPMRHKFPRLQESKNSL